MREYWNKVREMMSTHGLYRRSERSNYWKRGHIRDEVVSVCRIVMTTSAEVAIYLPLLFTPPFVEAIMHSLDTSTSLHMFLHALRLRAVLVANGTYAASRSMSC